MITPTSTYRLQFTPDFEFADAQRVVPYLKELGVSTVYASPIFSARKGSTHGYDVTDPRKINPELGGEAEFEKLNKAVKEAGMTWLQDIVPNHMAFSVENKMLMDVFEQGGKSRFYHFFDIDWDHPYEGIKGRVLAPFLGKFYSECLESGELKLVYEEAGLQIAYWEHRFPLRVESYRRVFEGSIEELKEKTGLRGEALDKFWRIMNSFRDVENTNEPEERARRFEDAKKALWLLYSSDENVRSFVDATTASFNGEPGAPHTFDKLDKLILEQVYKLSYWKVATEEVNYRRFFTINDLISLKIEDRPVFEFTHALILRLINEGKIDGLRIDHIDGLYDPTFYLKRLRDILGDKYIVVEKILEINEKLPKSWRIEGTTGYEFANYANGILAKRENARRFSKIYYKFTGLVLSYADLLVEKKRLIIGKHMAGYVDNLAHLLKGITKHDRYGRDITIYALKRSLVEVMAHFPVYRTYVNHDTFSAQDSFFIKEAVKGARGSMPAFRYELDFVEKFLLLDFDRPLTEEERALRVHFVMSFQQYTAPLVAKGFEDTILYIYNKLISLNEVGGNPNAFGFTLREFNAFNKRRTRRMPHTLNATATHDTKRGEDTRARINVLSEMPREWKERLKLWERLNRPKKTKVGEEYAPDRNDEYFIYQTLVGAFPFRDEITDEFRERIRSYFVKAVREAKVHTAWIKPDAEYESACARFVDRLLDTSGENRFLEEFLPFKKKVASFGILNSLSQLVLKFTSPGIPDIYRGTELWDFSLVDPDNRRPVDFGLRQKYLAGIKEKIDGGDTEALIDELFDTEEDGRVKMFLTFQLLRLRGRHKSLFSGGAYVPLEVKGRFKRNLVAFARRLGESWCLTVVPRFFTELVREDELPLEDIWQDTEVVLPEGAPGKWTNVITGETVESFRVADILKVFPVGVFKN